MMEAVEYSPDERYARYTEELGQGAYKTVYKAFDTSDALEVAWNKLHVDRLPAAEVAKVETEVALLRAVSHRNIINLYAFWREPRPDGRPASMDFITELMSSGTLKQYLKRVKSIKLRVIRRWCANLLDAIAYLHARSPPIMHRDLKCDNIFINGHLGEVCGLWGMRAGGRCRAEMGCRGPMCCMFLRCCWGSPFCMCRRDDVWRMRRGQSVCLTVLTRLDRFALRCLFFDVLVWSWRR